MNASTPFVQASFDYSQFKNQDLIAKAQETLSNFVGFVRQTFDRLIEVGQALQDLYDECQTISTNRKKVFAKWLDSFGASRYIARAAMELYKWFKDLDPRIQRLIRENVQSWKVSALRELRHLTIELLKQVVTSGKKTAAQVKEFSSIRKAISKRTQPVLEEKLVASSSTQDNQPLAVPALPMSSSEENNTNALVSLAPGTRIVVTNDDAWNGHAGIIMSVPSVDKFWVLLDYTVSQGMEVKHLLKREQILPEVKRIVTVPRANKMYSEAEVCVLIEQALTTRERETAELEQARFTEIRDAALESAKKEIIAAQQHARHMAKQKEQLAVQLAQATEEIYRLHTLQVQNQQLEQRIADLEKALESANSDRWNNTFTKQAAKVVNSDVEKTVVPLSSEVERLHNLVEKLSWDLYDMEVTNTKQQQELENYRHRSSLSIIDKQNSPQSEYSRLQVDKVQC